MEYVNKIEGNPGIMEKEQEEMIAKSLELEKAEDKDEIKTKKNEIN